MAWVMTQAGSVSACSSDLMKLLGKLRQVYCEISIFLWKMGIDLVRYRSSLDFIQGKGMSPYLVLGIFWFAQAVAKQFQTLHNSFPHYHLCSNFLIFTFWKKIIYVDYTLANSQSVIFSFFSSHAQTQIKSLNEDLAPCFMSEFLYVSRTFK